MSLVLDNLKKSYREPGGGKIPVLNVARLELQAAEQVALIGTSGGGKTTLLNVIAGITAPDSGRVLIDNTDVTSLNEASRDRFRALKIGFVFQTFNLLPAFTALENVLLGMCFAGKGTDSHRATDLLKRVGLGHRLNHRPPQLSVGEQQRVAVAQSTRESPVAAAGRRADRQCRCRQSKHDPRSDPRRLQRKQGLASVSDARAGCRRSLRPHRKTQRLQPPPMIRTARVRGRSRCALRRSLTVVVWLEIP